jgi:hypothetical protein
VAYLLRLPEHAAARFARSRPRRDDPVAVLHAWDRAWVAACIAHGVIAVPLRSAKGLLRRWYDGDPAVTFVAAHVAPLLTAVGGDEQVALAVWNVLSDPREVLDLRDTLAWSPERIARHITDLTVTALTR